MSRRFSVVAGLFVLPVAFIPFAGPPLHSANQEALAADNTVELVVENLGGSQFVHVVFHALDRGGFCNPPDGAVSLHPVLDMPVDFIIEAGDGIIIQSSSGTTAPGRSATGVRTYSTALNAASVTPIRSFPPLVAGITDECQAWINISQSVPGPLRVLVTAPGDDGGQVSFIADLAHPKTFDLVLNFRWSLITWRGADGMAPTEALRGPAGAADITSQVTVLYAWDAAAQAWRAFFPSGSGVAGANDLTALKTGVRL